MKKYLVVISVLALLISCGESTKKIDKTTVVPILKLANFDNEAGKFLDKEVAVKGLVDHVCKHGGKKILLVNDNGDVHVESETRFDDALVGSEISVKGIVEEFRVDEAYCLQKEEDHIQNHKDGTDSDEMHEKKMEQITFFRDSMKAAKSDHLSFYSLKYNSHEVLEGNESKEDVKNETEHDNVKKETEHGVKVDASELKKAVKK